MPVILCPKCQHKYKLEAPIYIASPIVFCPICLHIYSFEESGRAAEQGHPHAQYYLGYCYYHGLGVNVCRTLALSWFQKAAEQGLVDAQYMVGVCYDRGEGLMKTPIKLWNGIERRLNGETLKGTSINSFLRECSDF